MTLTTGSPPRSGYRLDDQLGEQPGTVTMSGVLALLRAPLDVRRSDAGRGLRTGGVVCGYRGSPLGTVDLNYESHRRLFEHNDIRFVNGVNEELAATVLWGAQRSVFEPTCTVDGVLGLWYGKAPGLDRAGDAIRHANLSGVASTGGVVLAVGDDPECKSSTVPSATEWTLADLAVPALYPATVQEVLDFGRHGYEISRRCGSWIGLKMHTDIADGYATVEVGHELPTIADFDIDGSRFVAASDDRMFAPFSLDLEREALTTRLDAVHHYVRGARLDTVIGDPAARIGVVAAGKQFGDTLTALRSLGIDLDEATPSGVRVLKPALVWPLEPELVRSFATGLDEVVVIEEKRPFIEDQVRSILYGHPQAPTISGRKDPTGAPLVPTGGVLDVDLLSSSLRRRLSEHLDPGRLTRPRIRVHAGPLPELPARTPYFCSGCPHNRSTVVPDGSVAGGGIGCHGMALFTRGRAEGTTQMGGEGAQWVGASIFSSQPHRFQNMGDGTLAHSGFLAVRQAVSAGTNVTFKILANGVVAMTGGQRAAGELSIPALTRQLEAEGVGTIAVITDDVKRHDGRFARHTRVSGRDHLDRVQRELREIPGVTALIYDQACAAELRRERKRGRAPTPTRRPMINEAVCEGCGDCGDVSNCLSVHPTDTPFGRKTRIHQDSCNLDMSCIEGDCPAFLIVDTSRATIAPPPAQNGHFVLAEPERVASAALLVAGIGGTGVVTLGQVLATAANLDGLPVSSVDQTGMAQKGGPVVCHLRVGDEAVGGAARIEAGRADTYLVLDLLTGVAAANLDRLDAERTVVVASKDLTPTGAMVADIGQENAPAFAELRSLIDDRSRRELNLYLDVEAAAEGRLPIGPATNFVLVGAAYQRGRLPMSATGIERAIELNGVAVAENTTAFRLGRELVAREAAFPAATDPGPPRLTPDVSALIGRVDTDPLLRETLAWRVPELIEYQNQQYAARYLEVVGRAREAELTLPGASSDFSRVVAERLFHLMAYKDEYEVARLHRRAAVGQQVVDEFGVGARASFLLQPPVATRFGLGRKISVGPRTASVTFWALSRLKFVRGTRLDPFGATAERREERALVAAYIDLVDQASVLVRRGEPDSAVALVGLASIIRGFGAVKQRNIERYRTQLDHELERSGLSEIRRPVGRAHQ